MRILLFFILFVMKEVWADPLLTIKTLSYRGSNSFGSAVTEGQITMPFVHGRKGVATAINKQLFKGQFDVPIPVHTNGYFTLSNEEGASSIHSQSFSVTRNDARILTILFDVEGCGAYCENYTTSYSFDSKTGKLLGLSELFTAKGMTHLQKQLEKGKRAEYRKMLATLQQDLQAAYRKREQPDIINDLQERIRLNRECLGEGIHNDRTPRIKADPYQFDYDFELNKKTILLKSGRCSNHAMRALDDVGDYTLELTYASLSPYLTNYGSRLLLNGKSVPLSKSNTKNIEDDDDDPLLFFTTPIATSTSLELVVGGNPVPAGEGWWILACDNDCALYTATLKVSETTVMGRNNEQIHAQKLQWMPIPVGQVVAIFKPAAASNKLHFKTGVVKTMDDSMRSSDTMNVSIPIDNRQTALLIPRVMSSPPEQIDRLELRIGSKYQSLPGYEVSESEIDGIQFLSWAGDLDNDGKLDLIISHSGQQVDDALYLSSLARPNELVRLAGSMKYEQSDHRD